MAASMGNGAGLDKPRDGDSSQPSVSGRTPDEEFRTPPTSMARKDSLNEEQVNGTEGEWARGSFSGSLGTALGSLFRNFSGTRSLPNWSQRRGEVKGKFVRANTEQVPRSGSLSSDVAPEVLTAMKSSRKLQDLLHRQASHFKVGKDYKVEIDTANLPSDLQEEFARVFKEPLFKDQGGVVSLERTPPTREDGKPREIPKLTICILIVGTRGDVQPFIAIGRKLLEYGHRVRLASHANYREFVMNEGLEFYPLGGDPKILAEYMVKNKGFLPSGPGEVTMQRKQLKAIIDSVWPACTEADVDSGGAPFVADAIIANPPTMAHITVAEALRVPLHVFFTMPWSPTEEFPSPLATVITNKGFENRLSYYVVDNLMWLGMKDMINSLRRRLKLKSIRSYHVTHYAIPYGYIWSPSLAPKPHDWGYLQDVVGFCFLDLASDYEPPEDLKAFLDSGSPPVFIGFGSLPVEDPKGMTSTIIEALEHTEQRGIIQKGWGGLGEIEEPPSNVFILGNCPHDWLFPRCKAVIHHGGAGTTAAGLKAGCPTTIVPFFGDQFFWGQKVCKAGVGPEPIPVTSFSLEKLETSINFMCHPEVQATAKLMAKRFSQEDGVAGAVNAFHNHLPEGFTAKKRETPWLLQTTNIARDHCGCCI